MAIAGPNRNALTPSLLGKKGAAQFGRFRQRRRRSCSTVASALAKPSGGGVRPVCLLPRLMRVRDQSIQRASWNGSERCAATTQTGFVPLHGRLRTHCHILKTSPEAAPQAIRKPLILMTPKIVAASQAWPCRLLADFTTVGPSTACCMG